MGPRPGLNAPAAAGAALFVPKQIAPTAEQLAIQTAPQRTLVIEANAGAAKTTTLALRLAESLERGIPPEKSLALTYTEPACEALRAALRRIGVPHELARRVPILSFEAFATRLLRSIEGGTVPQHPGAEALKPFVLEAMRRVADDPEERWRDELVFPAAGDAAVEDFLGMALQLKGTLQRQREAPGEAVTPALAEALGRSYAELRTFQAYERLRRGGHPDRPAFRGPSDASYDLACLIADDGMPRDDPAWPAQLRVLLLDEMHDLNQAMFEILARLLELNPAAFFCGAGDRDQVIHRLAGAEARFMGDAIGAATGRDPQRLPLSASFRFGPRLAGVAGRFARKPCVSASGHDTEIRIVREASAMPVEALITDEALRWRAEQGVRRLSAFAVLLRHAHQSVLLETRLLDAGLPYVTRGFVGYLERPEVLFVRALLAVATNDFSAVQEASTRERMLDALLQFADVALSGRPGDDEDPATLRREAVRAAVEDPSILSTIFEHQVLRQAEPFVRRRLEAAVAASAMANGGDALPRLLDALQPEALAARVLVEAARVREAVGTLDALRSHAAAFDSAAALFRQLNQAELRRRELKGTHSLVLASIAAVKGLEFDHVLLPHLARGHFPDAQSPLGDERNLFYVAITRARRRLTLYAGADAPSRFLAEIGEAGRPADGVLAA